MIIRNYRRSICVDSGALEIETLQTDIMRFMSILGFCLMAIFALVQSIPTGVSDSRPMIHDRELIKQEISRMISQLAELKAEQLTLATDIKQARAEKQVEMDKLADLKNNNVEQQNNIAAAQQKLKRLEQTIVAAQQQFVEVASALKEMNVNVSQRKQSLHKLKHQVLAKQKQIEKSKNALNELQHDFSKILEDVSTKNKPKTQARPKPQAKPKLKPQAKPQPQQSPKPSKRGFNLRFSSAATLESLVAEGKVRFYALYGNHTWELVYDSYPRFQKTTLPKSFHEMAPQTVPGNFLRLLEETLTPLNSRDVIWSVGLPADIRQAIKMLMGKNTGGELVIGSDGQVVLH